MKPGKPLVVRGTLLLEVVVSMTILVAAMGLLGAQLVRGLDMMEYAEGELRVSQMADRVLALVEFDPETQERLAQIQQTEGEYESDGQDETAFWGMREMYPGYFWRVRTERVDPESDELWMVEIEILYQADPELQDSIDDARVVRRLAMLKARPAQIDLNELDLSEEGLAQLGVGEDMLAQLPELLSMIGGLDTGSISLQRIMQMLDQDTLRMLMPMLQALLGQAGAGGGAGDLSSLLGQFTGGGNALPGGLEIPSDIPPDAAAALQELLQMAGEAGAGPPGQGPGARRGGGPGRRGAPVGGDDPGGPGGGPPAGAGGNSGATGAHTIEDLFRMREQYQRGNKGP